MKTWVDTFKNMPLRRKLLAIILVASLLSFVFTAVAVVVYELTNYRPRVIRDLSAQAAILAANLHAPLNFHDARAAREGLMTLKARTDIGAAAVYSKNGEIFARYGRDPESHFEFPIVNRGQRFNFKSKQVEFFYPIHFESELVGHLFLRSELPPLFSRLPQYGFMFAGVLVALLSVSILLLFSLKKNITGPISALAETLHSISGRSQGYHARAVKDGNDELGQLADSFNRMLSVIEKNEAELVKINKHLEHELYERTRAEEALKESEERLRLAVQAAQLGNLDWNIQEDRVILSDYLFQLFHLKSSDHGRKFDDFLKLIAPEDRDTVRRCVHDSITLRNPCRVEFRILSPSGTLHWMTLLATVYFDPADQPVRLAGVIQDVTDRKRAEEVIHTLNNELEKRVVERTLQYQTANRELEAFCYSVSHDLRAPLRSIEGYSYQLLDEFSGQLDETARTYLHRVRSATLRMSQLIEDLLRLSQVSRGEMKMEPVDISMMAQGIAVELQQSSPERYVEFDIQPGLVIHGDKQLFRIVLDNLLRNAWKFTRHRTFAHIELGSKSMETESVIYVRDNGAGFNMNYARKLFQPFQRLHPPDEYEGTGVGLATVQRIIQRHGGRVWAEGEVDKGAVIYFTLDKVPSSVGPVHETVER